MPTGRPGDRDGAADRGQDLAAQRAGVERGGRVPLVPRAGVQQGNPVRRRPARRDGGGRARGQARLGLVLRAVVDGEQRQRDAVADVGRATTA